MFKSLQTLFKHRWLDASHSRQFISEAAVQRLAQAVAQSEGRHDAQVRICIEVTLPLSYLWRHVWHKRAMAQVMRERALMLFGKLRVWDTERNNGVLIYLLLAEHRIELVVDRGLLRTLPEDLAQQVVRRLGASLREARFEEGLLHALEEISSLLERDFPSGVRQHPGNELPNGVVLL